MEKLQAAIEKARQQRTTQASAVPAGIDGSEQDVAAARESLWQAIAPLEQDRKDRLESRRVVALDGGRKSSSFDMLRTRIKQMMDATAGSALSSPLRMRAAARPPSPRTWRSASVGRSI